MKDEFSIDKPILFRITGRSEHEIGFRLLICKRDRGGTIGKTADDDLERLANEHETAVAVAYHEERG